jgi:hypothetical protein
MHIFSSPTHALDFFDGCGPPNHKLILAFHSLFTNESTGYLPPNITPTYCCACLLSLPPLSLNEGSSTLPRRPMYVSGLRDYKEYRRCTVLLLLPMPHHSGESESTIFATLDHSPFRAYLDSSSSCRTRSRLSLSQHPLTRM